MAMHHPPRVSQDEELLGQLAMRFRGAHSDVDRQAVAREYSEAVDRLIRGGVWYEAPAPEDQLPDEWMPKAFFEYWSGEQPHSASPCLGQGASSSQSAQAGRGPSFNSAPTDEKQEPTADTEPPTGDRVSAGGPASVSGEQGPASAQTAEALAALEAFVVDNDDLPELESRIGRFNIFDALGIARAEIRHSNFLAFILDPVESHGQGQLFLKAVLMDLLKAAPAESRPLSPIELDGTDLRGIEIRREWEHIDLLITCQYPPFVVAIENKVDAHEHSDQLRRYKEKVRQHHSQPALFVYLTPDADEPSDSDWMQYSYKDVYNVFTRVMATYRKAIGEDVLVFLDHYLNLIGTRFMNDEKIDELCRRIYKNHRQALELIIERGRPVSGVLAEAATVLREGNRWHVFDKKSDKYIAFVPQAWLAWLPPLGLDKNDPRSWIILRLYLRPRMLEFIVRVGPMRDAAKRQEIVHKLLSELPKMGFKKTKGGKGKGGYTRVSGADAVQKWSEDDEPESEAVQGAVKKKLDEIYPKLQAVATLLKSLFNLQESGKRP